MAMTKDISKIENYTERIDQAIGKMTEMISSFLYGTSRQTIEISNLISYIRAQIPVENELIKFNTDIEENIPPVYVNKIRIARALVNLIENALLAPNSEPEKKIEMKISSHFEFVRIKISDNGMGVSDQDIDKIWIIGYSKNNTTGLGLPFAKQTIDENNGRINLQTTYGKGTTVIVDLPISNKKEDNNVK
jgi:signal transduction histidine kinase